jgi:catechol 2,3-dioxygenase-like lactoylglutathione lyase family enzyme
MTETTTRVAQIALSVADLERSIAFYREVMGLPYAAERTPWDVDCSRVAFAVADVSAFRDECLENYVSGIGPLDEADGECRFVMKDPGLQCARVAGTEEQRPFHCHTLNQAWR